MVQGPWVSRVYYFRVACQTAVGMLGHASNSLPHRCCAAAVGAGPFDPNDPNAPPQPPSAWQAMLHAVSGGCTGIVVLPASVQFWCRGMPLTACIFKPCLPSRLIRLPACLLAGVVHFFGRLSFLVDENAHAMHFFISALLQLLDRCADC